VRNFSKPLDKSPLLWYNNNVKRGTPWEKPFESCAETNGANGRTETTFQRASGVLKV
jgi:hypothetical protein